MHTVPVRKAIFPALTLLGWLTSFSIEAQLSSNVASMIRRVNSGEFSGGSDVRGGGGRRGARAGGERRWVEGGRGYSTVERGELVRYDTATGKREVLMSAKELTPPKFERALSPVESGSADGKHMLFATNPRTVMIRKIANDYWVLDKAAGGWHKLGGKTNSGLLYAKLSSDGTRAAYVRGYNIYVEDVGSGAIKQLTRDGSENIINGTSDWVNEEEFGIRDAFEWSPDGRRIAFLQFDQSNVPEFTLINYTDTLYPALTKYHYPKPGQTNSAVRLGVVSASGGSVRWMKVPGDRRSIYIARIGWANSDVVILQQLNRLQNTNNVWLANAKSGQVRLMFQDRDEAWVSVNDRFIWLESGSSRRKEALNQNGDDQSLLSNGTPPGTEHRHG